MSLLSFLFNKENKSASTAKERLQIIIARERTIHNGPDFMPALHQELLAVISKYVQVNPEDIKISLDRQGNLEVLDVNVVLPDVTASSSQRCITLTAWCGFYVCTTQGQRHHDCVRPADS